jgi:hypothetical protein
MDRMLPIKRAIFLEFQLFLSISPVFAGGIVFALTVTALKRYQFHYLFLARHILSPKPLTCGPFSLVVIVQIRSI